MKVNLDRHQKIAFARMFTDLIEADFVVDEHELTFFESVVAKSGLHITQAMLVESKKMTLAQAVQALKELDAPGRAAIIEILRALSLSDGDCAPGEARLIFAIEQSLSHDATLFSVPATDLSIANGQALFVETHQAGPDESLHRQTRCREAPATGDAVAANLVSSGYDIVYVPAIVDDFRAMRPDYLRKVVRYMIPSVCDDRVEAICHDLQTITTARFCREVLCRKMGLPLIDVPPSLLIKVSRSAIISKYDAFDAKRCFYDNYLCLPISGSEALRRHRRPARSDASGMAVPAKPTPFRYDGFHRTLFELIAFGRQRKDYRLNLDLRPGGSGITFVPEDGVGESIPLRLNPQEAVLYAMIVRHSLGGRGLDWRERMPEKDHAAIMSEYNAIYQRIGNGRTTTDYKDRTQIHHIKRRIQSVDGMANVLLFLPVHVRDGESSFYRVPATPSDVVIVQ